RQRNTLKRNHLPIIRAREFLAHVCELQVCHSTELSAAIRQISAATAGHAPPSSLLAIPMPWLISATLPLRFPPRPGDDLVSALPWEKFDSLWPVVGQDTVS